MRIYVTVLVALLMVLTVSIITPYRLDASAGEILAGFGEMEKAINRGNWEEASAGIDITEKLWNKDKGWWAVVIDHQEIDHIDMSLLRTKEYISKQDRTMASGELAVLRQMLEHIPQKEQVNLKNIF
ncbi:hypothetical protein SPSYN_02665 [Sporotomaculum syntrophicum]|uniref:DUF4363 family protein n=1 Tax=Sporotomaculum syntrophicum TaxID=182264 RepID=A0A9D2WNY7_9FIRM|nr:DUF4363 family protein [Sporotomaculum syntrophicum]KAF1084261.1 hypothetical protein SPSYN_02665 [Sporotomaculum syntrophicum]